MKRFVGLVVGMLAVITMLTACGGTNFKNIEKTLLEEDPGLSSYIDVAGDGSYLEIDTNPLDIEDVSDFDAYVAVDKVNKILKFPESVMVKIGRTSSLNGVQTHEGDGVTLTWKYHPDSGLEALYEKTK